jgi:hypothetical protein
MSIEMKREGWTRGRREEREKNREIVEGGEREE